MRTDDVFVFPYCCLGIFCILKWMSPDSPVCYCIDVNLATLTYYEVEGTTTLVDRRSLLWATSLLIATAARATIDPQYTQLYVIPYLLIVNYVYWLSWRQPRQLIPLAKALSWSLLSPSSHVYSVYSCMYINVSHCYVILISTVFVCRARSSDPTTR